MDDVELASLWAILRYRGRLQELAACRALDSSSVVVAGGRESTRPGAMSCPFEAFLVERAAEHRRRPTPSAPAPKPSPSVLSLEEDPTFLLETEMEFLRLGRAEKAWWLQRAPADRAARCADWMPRGL